MSNYNANLMVCTVRPLTRTTSVPVSNATTVSKAPSVDDTSPIRQGTLGRNIVMQVYLSHNYTTIHNVIQSRGAICRNDNANVSKCEKSDTNNYSAM